MKRDTRIRKVASNSFRSKLKAEDIAITENNNVDSIVLGTDKSKSILFNIDNPLIIPDVRIFHGYKAVSVHQEQFVELVKTYLFINEGISKFGINLMAEYIVKRYSKQTKEGIVKHLRSGEDKMFYVEKTYLDHESVFKFILAINKNNISFDNLVEKYVYVLYSKNTLLGYSARKEISLSYYVLAREKAGLNLIKATIQELSEQDRILKITNTRIANRANLSRKAINNKIDVYLTNILIKHNQYRFITTAHSFDKLKEFISIEKNGKTVKHICEKMNINIKSYYLFKRIVDSMTHEELDKVNFIKF
jgi:hypothetical protein